MQDRVNRIEDANHIIHFYLFYVVDNILTLVAFCFQSGLHSNL
jgi:hypothetical protein